MTIGIDTDSWTLWINIMPVAGCHKNANSNEDVRKCFVFAMRKIGAKMDDHILPQHE